jgi:hypothetical protein
MKTPCQAVLIRYAADPSRGELLNIGVLLYAPTAGFLGARFVDSWARITKAFPSADSVHLRRVATAVTKSCSERLSEQLVLDAPSNVVAALHSAVPADDASLSHSPVISGVTADPTRTLNELFARFVEEEAPSEERRVRNEQEIWKTLGGAFRARGIHTRLVQRTLTGRHYSEDFEAAWKNGLWHVAKPLSLDLTEPHAILAKAASWSGRIVALDPQSQDARVVLVLGMPSSEAPQPVRDAAEHGAALLREQLVEQELAEVYPESAAGQLAERIANDLEHSGEAAE